MNFDTKAIRENNLRYWYELVYNPMGPIGSKQHENDLLVGEDVLMNLRRHLQECRDCVEE